MRIMYHVFTNQRDDWFSDYKEAKKQYNDWKKEFDGVRMYEEKWDDIDDIPQEENCILSYGNFPY